jgi:hypothetical protein
VVKIRSARADVIDQFGKALPSLDAKAAASVVPVRANDREIVMLSKCRNCGGLVLYRVALIVGRHPNILRSAQRRDLLR